MFTAKNKLTIGLFGFGVVGEGLYQVLHQTQSLQTTIRKICIKQENKKRNAPAELFTTNPADLLEDPEIDVIVELIDDAQAAWEITRTALSSGKAVVSANKKMIAEHLAELLQLQDKYQSPFLYEAACCASIPVIRNLEEYYNNDLLQGLQGIVNGSTNYILSRISEDGLAFEQALQLAQKKGFAESDSTLDIEGIDAVNKLSILLAHAYGLVIQPNQLVHSGIHRLHAADAVFAKEKQFDIKLVAQARKLKNGKLAAFVLPQFVKKDSLLAEVRNEYNGVIIESGLAEQQFFYGKGAGGFPTASAVLSDLSALRYNYRYEYKKRITGGSLITDDFYLRVYMSFDSPEQVPDNLFERIEEWNCNEHRCTVSGILHFSHLRTNWWREPHSSLILYPDAIVEQEELPETSSTSKLIDFLELSYRS